jgi:pimeloyl-ACP methyl ester carboxylesterase
VERGLTDVVLLGHSYGGTIICKVAEAIPERVRRLVFLGGVVTWVMDRFLPLSAPADEKTSNPMVGLATSTTALSPTQVRGRDAQNFAMGLLVGASQWFASAEHRSGLLR